MKTEPQRTWNRTACTVSSNESIEAMSARFESLCYDATHVRTLVLALAVLLGPALTGCDPPEPRGAEVAVMSQNLYLGGDLFQLLAPECSGTPGNPVALPVCVDRLYTEVVASDFAARAEAFADEIARVRPVLVGLQEVTTYYVQAPGDNLPGAPNTPATEVTIDFLDLLLGALADRDLDYMAVSISRNADVEFPAFDGGGFYDVRYRDADVVLALDDSDVTIGATEEHAFATLLEIPIGGTVQTFFRGYQTVDATVEGFRFTFSNTHLEVGGSAGPIQEAQAAELAGVIGALAGPVVLTGDLNSEADGSGTGSYATLTGSLADVFGRPDLEAEPTCCQAPDLQNEASALDARIDFVLYRGFDRVMEAETVLDAPGDRVESGGLLLWPSDHAGVATRLVADLE